MSKYVLQDSLETKRRNKPVYFGGYSIIGPMYTENLDEAVSFKSKELAMKSLAYANPMCFFEPISPKEEDK